MAMMMESPWSGMRPLSVTGRKRWIAVVAAILAMAATMVSQSAPREDRISQAVNVAEVVKIAGSVPAAARRATDLGEVDSGMR
ncbi:MAG: hypothetical protein ABSD13_04695, partial [Candidatus Korobacteraceae bacterium]